MRTKYQYIQTIDISSTKFNCLLRTGILKRYHYKQYFDISDIVITRDHCNEKSLYFEIDEYEKFPIWTKVPFCFKSDSCQLTRVISCLNVVTAHLSLRQNQHCEQLAFPDEDTTLFCKCSLPVHTVMLLSPWMRLAHAADTPPCSAFTANDETS